MKIFIKIVLFFLALFMALSIGFTLFYLIQTSDSKLDESKLFSPKDVITFYDGKGNEIFNQSKDLEITLYQDIPNDLIDAFVSIEDKRFYSHNGVDYKAILRAFFKNLTSFSFKEGGSTISQQLIKNTHFTGEKTIKRKLSEIKLAKKLEKKFSKEEILEKYLNTIYFGSNCFGISKASKKYFNKEPKELNLSECAILAGIVKSPSNYSPFSDIEKCTRRRNVVLSEMLKEGYITKSDYETAINSKIVVEKDNDLTNLSYFNSVNEELDYLIDKFEININGLKIYTYFDNELQTALDEGNLNANSDYSAIVMDKNSSVLAYSSTCGELKRQLGSTIKPILVYAPAIDLNEIDECSFILDEKTNFNGYEPKNFGDKYYGVVTVKEALSKSLNVPCVKILNSIGIENAKKYLSKTNLRLSENDLGLNVSLGVTNDGYKLKDLTSVYASFINRGIYNKPNFVSKILDSSGKVLYKRELENNRIFEEDTAFIINDMLKETANTGTAKKLKSLNYEVCAKTGTVGNEKGNTDVYCVTYNGEIALSVWYGNANSSYLDNSILGGNLPTQTCYNVLSKIYNNRMPTKLFSTDAVEKIRLDKISFLENKIEIADDIAPNRFVLESYFKKSRIPKDVSTRFSSPTIENAKILVNKSDIEIRLCQTELINSLVYKELNGEKTLVLDTKDLADKNLIIDKYYIENTNYIYSAIPYYELDGKRYYGKEVIIGQIKSPTKNVGDDWWVDDF